MQDAENRFPDLRRTRMALTGELNRRFAMAIDLRRADFDPTLLICCMLSPEKSAELMQELFDHGKEELRKFYRASLEPVLEAEEGVIEDQDRRVADVQAAPCERPLPIRRRRFVEAEQANLDPLAAQLNDYMSFLERGNLCQQSFAFWEANRDRFSLLYGLAVQMLAIPATSAPVERMFSQAGLSASGQRKNIGPDLIESEVILKYNKHISYL